MFLRTDVAYRNERVTKQTKDTLVPLVATIDMTRATTCMLNSLSNNACATVLHANGRRSRSALRATRAYRIGCECDWEPLRAESVLLLAACMRIRPRSVASVCCPRVCMCGSFGFTRCVLSRWSVSCLIEGVVRTTLRHYGRDSNYVQPCPPWQAIFVQPTAWASN